MVLMLMLCFLWMRRLLGSKRPGIKTASSGEFPRTQSKLNVVIDSVIIFDFFSTPQVHVCLV